MSNSEQEHKLIQADDRHSALYNQSAYLDDRMRAASRGFDESADRLLDTLEKFDERHRNHRRPIRSLT